MDSAARRRRFRRIRNKRGFLRGYSGCYRCGDTWDWAEHHTTTFENGSGCFPLCEPCWSELSPVERVPYYDALVNEWIRQLPGEAVEYDRKRDLIRMAVIAGG